MKEREEREERDRTRVGTKRKRGVGGGMTQEDWKKIKLNDSGM